MSNLLPYQEAIWQAITDYGMPPIDQEHLSMEKRDGSHVVSFHVPAQSASEFAVGLILGAESYVLSCEGWHEECLFVGTPSDCARQVLEKLITLFAGRTKLLITYAGKSPYRWELLHNYKGDTWESLSITRLFFFNYFGKRHVEARVNAILQADTLAPQRKLLPELS